MVGTSTNGPIYLVLSDAASCSSYILGDPEFTVSDVFDIRCSNHQLQVRTELRGTLTLLDANGRRLGYQVVSTDETVMDLEGFGTGLYFVKLEDGFHRVVRKFVNR